MNSSQHAASVMCNTWFNYNSKAKQSSASAAKVEALNFNHHTYRHNNLGMPTIIKY